jgi:hypothetical protein
MIRAQKKNQNNKLKLKRKRKNSDRSLTVLTTVNGKRKIDFRKVIRCLSSLVAIQTSREP